MSSFTTVTAFLTKNKNSAETILTTSKTLDELEFIINCFNDSIYLNEDAGLNRDEIEIECCDNEESKKAMERLILNRTGGQISYCFPSKDDFGDPVEVIFQSCGEEKVDLIVFRVREQLLKVDSTKEIMNKLFVQILDKLNCIYAIQFTDRYDDDNINEVELLNKLYEQESLPSFKLEIQ